MCSRYCCEGARPHKNTFSGHIRRRSTSPYDICYSVIGGQARRYIDGMIVGYIPDGVVVMVPRVICCPMSVRESCISLTQREGIIRNIRIMIV